MGWRYYLWTIGALVLALFVTRALVFRLHESPKFLVGRGRDARAVRARPAARVRGEELERAPDLARKVRCVRG